MEFNGNRYIGDIVLKRRPEGGSYLNDIPAVKYLMEAGHIELRSPVTFFIGENGTGKSTLLEAIAVAVGFNPEGGTRNFNFSTRNTHSELCDCISLTRYGYPKDGFFLRAESFYNVASNIDELDEAGGFGPQIKDSYGGRSLHAQSQPLWRSWIVPSRRAGGCAVANAAYVAACGHGRSCKESLTVHHLYPFANTYGVPRGGDIPIER